MGTKHMEMPEQQADAQTHVPLHGIWEGGYLEDCAQEVVHKVVTLGSTRALPSHSCMEKDRYCPNLRSVYRVHNARGTEGYPAARQVLFYSNLIKTHTEIPRYLA
ncbi:predicted protein [Histoplasma capsulatum H143]|uniref:Uncharacterized protein n=1 Tax=Ajellomyces capsulatus (strain H143) TaxID=544712 RepID=C6H399_AJECH|nr:predicted protein [Histoplasma capsulatum H143]